MRSLLHWVGAGLLLLLLMLAAHAGRAQDVARQLLVRLPGSLDLLYVAATARPEALCRYSLTNLAPTREGYCLAEVIGCR